MVSKKPILSKASTESLSLACHSPYHGLLGITAFSVSRPSKAVRGKTSLPRTGSEAHATYHGLPRPCAANRHYHTRAQRPMLRMVAFLGRARESSLQRTGQRPMLRAGLPRPCVANHHYNTRAQRPMLRAGLPRPCVANHHCNARAQRPMLLRKETKHRQKNRAQATERRSLACAP